VRRRESWNLPPVAVREAWVSPLPIRVTFTTPPPITVVAATSGSTEGISVASLAPAPSC
jgi:hypothetical protein